MNSLTDKEINRASDGIDKALSTATRSNRGEVAFRILSVVRNLNDHIAFKIWKDVRPDQKMDINKVASKFGNVRPYQFVARFDHFLRASVSHFTPSEEGAERLMIKYYRYLLQLKKAVYDRYGMIILRNVDMFLEDLDEQTKDYYQKVAAEIEKRLRIPPPKNFDNYYINKIKPFFVNQEIYERVDLVIFLNGIAIMSFELKCNAAGQSYQDAIYQYRVDRDPNTRLFRFKAGCLVNFAMDLEQVYMTTKLAGNSTFFLPFNMGNGEGVNAGAGNPTFKDKYSVSYMWEDILKKDR